MVQIEGHYQQLDGVFEGHVRIKGTNQDRATVFRFAHLEIGRIFRRLDEIAFPYIGKSRGSLVSICPPRMIVASKVDVASCPNATLS